jgi:hypothetical protein
MNARLCATIAAGFIAVRLPAPSELQVRAIASPAGFETSAPQLSVSEKGPLLSWIERSGSSATLKFSERSAGAWLAARTVASGTDWFVNWADVPSVIRLGDGSLAAHWLQKSAPGSYAYDVRLTFSRDDGRSWSPSVTPHHDGTKTEHGFASLFQMPGDGLGLVWLDGRATPEEGHAMAGMGSGAMTLQFAAFDRTRRQTADAPVDLRVCDCCPTSIAVTADGPIVAFRNRTENEIRDIYISRLEGQRWTEPVAVHDDGWKITGCPVNGPALSARGRDVAIAWFTAAGGQGRAFVAFSSNAGRSFGPPIRVDEDRSIGRVDVELLPDGSAAALWIEDSSSKAELQTRRMTPDGQRSSPIVVAAVLSSRASGFPRLVRDNDELLFAWTGVARRVAGVPDGASRVQVAAAPIPSLTRR